MSGDLFINTGLTVYRAMVGFLISMTGGILIGAAMSRNVIANWFFDPIVSVGFPMPKIAFLPVVILWLGVYDLSKITIIVIDCIVMEVEQNRKAVIKAFRDALARDKTRTQVFDISDLGLVEMTRKRIGEGLLESFSGLCPEWEGRGVLIDHALID